MAETLKNTYRIFRTHNSPNLMARALTSMCHSTAPYLRKIHWKTIRCFLLCWIVVSGETEESAFNF